MRRRFFARKTFPLHTFGVTDMASISHVRYINILKPRPNDRNMPTQHIATLLGAKCCVRLATMLRYVATCWVLLAQIWLNTSQHGGQTHATCCAQQCCDMLRWHVAIVWPGLYLGTWQRASDLAGRATSDRGVDTKEDIFGNSNFQKRRQPREVFSIFENFLSRISVPLVFAFKIFG